MFSLIFHKSLLTLSGEKVVRIQGDKSILAIGPASTQFTPASADTCQGTNGTAPVPRRCEGRGTTSGRIHPKRGAYAPIPWGGPVTRTPRCNSQTADVRKAAGQRAQPPTTSQRGPSQRIKLSVVIREDFPFAGFPTQVILKYVPEFCHVILLICQATAKRLCSHYSWTAVRLSPNHSLSKKGGDIGQEVAFIEPHSQRG